MLNKFLSYMTQIIKLFCDVLKTVISYQCGDVFCLIQVKISSSLQHIAVKFVGYKRIFSVIGIDRRPVGFFVPVNNRNHGTKLEFAWLACCYFTQKWQTPSVMMGVRGVQFVCTSACVCMCLGFWVFLLLFL